MFAKRTHGRDCRSGPRLAPAGLAGFKDVALQMCSIKPSVFKKSMADMQAIRGSPMSGAKLVLEVTATLPIASIALSSAESA
jgi:hypothetical protein